MVNRNEANWWRQAVVYQIYPRSFADANGDGIGDLKGITERVPYLSALGVDAVWLSPFYPSDLADGGYDVADYRDVDPKIGTLEDFDVMMAAFKKVDIKVVVDVVPNHSSDKHEWFQAALKASPGSAERDKYIFRDGKGPNGEQPPNDWQSTFGGSAWTRVPDGQWYFHWFDTAQPDLNWANQEVKDDFLQTFRFWGDRGVSGFRIDVAHGCAKDLSEPLPDYKTLMEMFARKLTNGNAEFQHPIHDRDEVHEIYRSWRKVFNEYNPPLTAVAESWVAPDRKHLYASADGLGQAFSFDILILNYDPKLYKDCIDSQLRSAKEAKSSTTWVLSNHDVVRHASRFGMPDLPVSGDHHVFQKECNKWLLSNMKGLDLATGLRKANSATLLLLGLPGSTYLYQGEELGLPEVDEMAPEARDDPIFIRTKGEQIGRDGCRVPLPWTASGSNFGFGSGTPHLPQPEWYAKYAVDVLDKDAGSTLNLYRKALGLRRELQAAEELEWVTSDKDVLHFKRPGGWEVVMNGGSKAVPLPKGKVLVSSDSTDLASGELPAYTTVWLQA